MLRWMDLRFTQHAKDVIAERKIEVKWVERVLLAPQLVEDADDGLRHFFARILEREGRVLRVVVDPARDAWWVVTAFLDRRMKDRLP
ncbi:MAG: DUF4258 domain-containing protein [Phycisphaerales bacterium]|nr:DUF4258 domain-containing protein [Phycisphaerales bacterium]